MTNQSQKQYATEREIAETFGLGVKALRYARMRGDGPPWKKVSGRIGTTGGRVLYPVAGVRAWLESRPGGGEVVPA